MALAQDRHQRAWRAGGTSSTSTRTPSTKPYSRHNHTSIAISTLVGEGSPVPRSFASVGRGHSTMLTDTVPTYSTPASLMAFAGTRYGCSTSRFSVPGYGEPCLAATTRPEPGYSLGAVPKPGTNRTTQPGVLAPLRSTNSSLSPMSPLVGCSFARATGRRSGKGTTAGHGPL